MSVEAPGGGYTPNGLFPWLGVLTPSLTFSSTSSNIAFHKVITVPDKRAILVERLIRVTNFLRCSPAVLFSSIFLLDKFQSEKKSLDLFNLLPLALIKITSSLDGFGGVDVKRMLKNFGYESTTEDLDDMEKKIRSTIDIQVKLFNCNFHLQVGWGTWLILLLFRPKIKGIFQGGKQYQASDRLGSPPIILHGWKARLC